MFVFLTELTSGFFHRTDAAGALRKRMLTLLIVCIVISLQGCASLLSQSRAEIGGSKECSFPLYTYGGTLFSIGMFATTVAVIPKKPEIGVLSALIAADFPFTVAMDTITLPISVARDIAECTKRYTTKKTRFKKPLKRKLVERKPQQLKKPDEEATSQEVKIFWYETSEPTTK